MTHVHVEVVRSINSAADVDNKITNRSQMRVSPSSDLILKQ